VHRGARERPDGALRTRLQNGDIVGNHHAERSQAKPGLAQLRGHLTRQEQDPAFHSFGGGKRGASSSDGASSRRRFAASTSTRRSSTTARWRRSRRVWRHAGDESVCGDRLREVDSQAVLSRLVGQDALREKPADGAIASVVKRVLGAPTEQKIKVSGVDDLMVVLARCCNPIRGERIVGYISRGKGVSVHAATCPNVVNLLYDPERRIDVEWDRERTSCLHGAAADQR
jgi:(p)ppGpp synthase/HD superfamily hydrolase